MKKLVSLVSILLISQIAFASQSLQLNEKDGEIEFSAKGPLVRVNGKGQGAVGELSIVDNKASGSLILNLAKLDTGISLRDDHMKNKYLQVKEHPTAVLTLKDVVLPKNLKGKVKFQGLLKLHGVEKPVKGVAKIKGVKAGKVKILADFKIRFSDFNIELPSFKLVSVGEEIKIKVKSTAIVAEKKATEKTAAL